MGHPQSVVDGRTAPSIADGPRCTSSSSQEFHGFVCQPRGCCAAHERYDFYMLPSWCMHDEMMKNKHVASRISVRQPQSAIQPESHARNLAEVVVSGGWSWAVATPRVTVTGP